MHISNIGAKSRAFINHKPFHPGNFKNVEAVWQVEEDKRQAEKNAKERAQIRAEESKVEALKGQLRQFEAAGTVSKNQSIHGLDWMYENPADAARVTEENAILLGKKEATPATVHKRQGSALADAEGPDEALKQEIGFTVTEDTLRKMREDPLFVIKLADQKYTEKMLANPYTRQHIISREDTERRERLSQTAKGRIFLQLQDEITDLKEKIRLQQMKMDELSQKKRRTDQIESRRKKPRTSSMTQEEKAKRLAEMSQNANTRDDQLKARADNHRQNLDKEDERERERVLRKLMQS